MKTFEAMDFVTFLLLFMLGGVLASMFTKGDGAEKVANLITRAITLIIALATLWFFFGVEV